jgi:flagellar hook-associated protein 3 FlgL
VFKLLDDIITELDAGRSATQFQDAMTKQHDNVVAERAALGAKVNRVDLVVERLKDEDINIQKMMSQNEDADMADVITQLKMQEAVHRAALGTGSRVIQPTLLDFLR